MFRNLYIGILCIFVLTAGPIEAKRATGGSNNSGGSASRGQSGSRTGVQHTNQKNSQHFGSSSRGGAGSHPVHHGETRTGVKNVQPQGSYQPTQTVQPKKIEGIKKFLKGTGPGSSASTGTFKKALIGGALGAVGGILAYKAGKAIIKSVTKPLRYNNRNYHWDNHGGQVKFDEFQCQMPWSQFIEPEPTSTTTTTTTTTSAPDAAIQILSEADSNATIVEYVSLQNSTTAAPVSMIPTPTPNPNEVLQNIQYEDGSRPKTIVWTCKRGREVCCGTDCCPASMENQDIIIEKHVEIQTASSIGGALMLILVLLVLTCCGCCCIGVFCFCRSVFFCCGDDDEQQEYHDEEQQQLQMEDQQPSYPPIGGYYPNLSSC